MGKPVSDVRAASTRAYRWGTGAVVAISGTSTDAAAFSDLGTVGDNEVMLEATVECYVAIGTSAIAAASSSSPLHLSAGERWHLRLEPDDTHYRAIAVSTSGSLRLVAAV